ncbi:MAG: hypothetical protein IJ501_06640 [Bacilli bacterium]|nr:hypothetical protein [Bacilli bacterium]
MNKEEYKVMEEIKRLVDEMLATIRRKESDIKVLQAEIEQLYVFINNVEHIGELESYRLERLKDSDIK